MTYLILLLFSFNAFSMVMPDEDATGAIVTKMDAFASKSNHTFSGHGVNCTAAPSTTSNCDFTIPYSHVKFNGIEIINGQIGDYTNLKIVDTATGTYSTVPNYTLNQFGYTWYLKAEPTKEILPYVSDLYQGMIIRVEYNNASAQARTIYVNFYIHQQAN